MEMAESIIIALISGGLAVISNLITSGQSKKLITYRLDQLEEKQDKHNNVIERTVIAEQSIKAAHHRIDGIEGKIK